MYSQIVSLRDCVNKQEKGYKFEQIAREILPWSYKPPISISSVKETSEQIDAFFEWNGTYYLVEVKAKEKKITPGSSDWEDFELKLRKRGGRCTGIFLSLGSVSSGVIDSAKNLNRQGHWTIVLHGNHWDELEGNYIPFKDLLRYMLFRVRSVFDPCPQDISHVKRWCYNRDDVIKHISSICQKESSVFLRRYKLIRHEELYVKRAIEKKIYDAADLLIPSKLNNERKRRKIKGKRTILTDRASPKQVVLIRDSSGCGKTTLMVNCSLERKKFFGFAKAASENDIDRLMEVFLNLGNDYGINKIIAANKPLVLLIDSLDEASKLTNKKREIISIMKQLNELNSLAIKHNMIAYPILLVFTLRDDYWRDWESVFEGQRMRTYRKQFSVFTEDEYSVAQEKYSSSYKYEINNDLSVESKMVLSVPFNLQIFSESHEYHGLIDIEDVFEEDVMHLYFQRKREEILKRKIPGFYSNEFMAICCELAMICNKTKSNGFLYEQIVESITGIDKTFKINLDDIILALKSEHIIMRDPENHVKYRFRHSRFLEYLIAYHIVCEVLRRYNKKRLEDVTDQTIDSGIVSMFRVYDYMRDISAKEFPDRCRKIEEFYSESKIYMAGNVSRLRSNIASGSKTNKEDIKLIIRHTKASDPENIWNSFFIIAAKKNGQKKDRLLEFFTLAWKKNQGKPDRWKLLIKINQHGLLLEEDVFLAVSGNFVSKEWQVYLGLILENGYGKKFLVLWSGHKHKKIKNEIRGNKDYEWAVVRKLLEIVENNEEYVPGEFI